MMETRVVKLFKNGASQAVRLPVEFRFEGEEIFATRDTVTGDVVLSSRPGMKAWGAFFELVHSVDDAAGFMTERPLNTPPSEHGVFDDALTEVPATLGR